MALGCKGCRKDPHTEEDCDFSVAKGYERGQCTCQHRQNCKVLDLADGSKVIAPEGVTRIDVR
jgi:hypothetical protein